MLKINNKIDLKQFLRKLPKVELHLHLEGAIPLQTLLTLIQKYERPDYISLSELRKRFVYTNFDHFIKTWYWKNNFIKEYEDYEFIAENVARNLAQQNIRYAEIYFSPSDYQLKGTHTQEIAQAVRRGLNKHIDNIEINLIADLVRDETNKIPQLEQLIEVKDQGIIGIGLGGKENEFPPKLFKNVFQKAKENGFFTTCHAGEAAGADYIWQAIQDLKVDRIGHGLASKDDPELVKYLIDHKIPVEMCPISNVKTASISSMSNHPIVDFYRRGMVVSVNTDDPKMFNTSLEEEFLTLMKTFNLDLDDIYNICQNGIQSLWCSEIKKNELLAELNQYYKFFVN